MINNNYAYEINLDIDLSYIKKIILQHQFDKIKNLNDHQRLVSNDDYLTGIKNKFSFLSPVYSAYYLYPNHNIPAHIDAKRCCALNIPVSFTALSDTVFYKFINDPILEYNESRVYHTIKSDIVEDFKFTLTRPTLINNSIPHGVINRNTSDARIILSWSIDASLTFEQAKEIFIKAGL